MRLIEIKQLKYEDLPAMDDMSLDALLQDPDTPDEARYHSLFTFLPHIEKELTHPGVTRWVLWG